MLLAVLALLAALTWPLVRRASFQSRLDTTATVVERARDAILAYREELGHWPPGAEPGRIPEGLAPFLPPETAFQTRGHVLQVHRWEAVAPPLPRPTVGVDPPAGPGTATPPPPDSLTTPPPRTVPLSGLTVHTSERSLLAGLVHRFGPADSFVRDSTWTLVIPRRPPTRIDAGG